MAERQILSCDIGQLPSWVHETKIDMQICEDPSSFETLMKKINSRISQTVDITSKVGNILDLMRRKRTRDRNLLHHSQIAEQQKQEAQYAR